MYNGSFKNSCASNIVSRSCQCPARWPVISTTGVRNSVLYLIIGTDVDADRQGGIGINTCASSVQLQFANGDTHTVGAQVTQTQNAFTISEDDAANMTFRPVGQNRANVALVLNGDVQALQQIV